VRVRPSAGDRRAEDRRDLEEISADRTERPQRDVVLARERAHVVLARRVDE